MLSEMKRFIWQRIQKSLTDSKRRSSTSGVPKRLTLRFPSQVEASHLLSTEKSIDAAIRYLRKKGYTVFTEENRGVRAYEKLFKERAAQRILDDALRSVRVR